MTLTHCCRHVSLANAIDDRPADLAHLLRRVADFVDELNLAPHDILDLTVSSEITEDGPWWSASIYWSSNDTG